VGKSSQEIDDWAKAYIAAQQDPKRLEDDHPLWWAIDGFFAMLGENSVADAEDAWRAILRVLELDPPAEVLGVLAAGPLEDLVDVHGAAFIDRIEVEARRDPKFRALLNGVWQSSTDAIWSRVEACRGSVVATPNKSLERTRER
jgi:hypothetical protein